MQAGSIWPALGEVAERYTQTSWLDNAIMVLDRKIRRTLRLSVRVRIPSSPPKKELGFHKNDKPDCFYSLAFLKSSFKYAHMNRIKDFAVLAVMLLYCALLDD
jgi:hypothetical protein